jgi:hypothetical protein
MVGCLGDGLRVKVQAVAALADKVSTDVRQAREKQALGEHISVSWLCLCLSGVVRAVLVNRFLDGHSARWSLVSRCLVRVRRMGLFYYLVVSGSSLYSVMVGRCK